MIDWKRVEELRDEIGEEGFAEVVELFLDEVETVVMRLRSEPSTEHYEEDLHFLKGSAWNLGFAAFGALCQGGERTAAAGRARSVDIREILDCYGRSKAQFMERAADYGFRRAAA
ncbi:Hpt domain-containing protein [Ostreiculturibacter nitratireducens]|uniref:Hpt domain-containing protein n=1 Tax=Ostreiculturibacter nitratireducens TaxID=3075226 RepID=UPI0031B577CD